MKHAVAITARSCTRIAADLDPKLTGSARDGGAMILTVTLNPAVDLTVSVDHLQVGGVNRYHSSQLDPAGKGINVARMAHRLGWPAIAFGFAAGEIGLLAQAALDTEGVPHQFVRVPGQTRVSVTAVDEQTTTSTSLRGPGPAIPWPELQALEAQLRLWLPAARVLVLAGRLPPGVPDDAYARYIAQARQHGVKTILDADGEPERLGLAARPYLIKPNVAEAERLLERALPDVAAVVAGARDLAARGVAVVVISMGPRGAVCAHDGRVWLATPPPAERRSAVGSGDSLVAGLAVALAREASVVDGLRLGTAAGAATAMTTGTALGDAAQIGRLLPQVRVTQITQRAATA